MQQEMRPEGKELIKERYEKTPSITFWVTDHTKKYRPIGWQFLHIALIKKPLEELNEGDKIYRYELKIPIRYNI